MYATAVDPDGGVITYKWSTNKGNISGTTKTVSFKAPATEGVSTIQVIATDAEGNSDTAAIDLTVVLKINQAPRISDIQKSVAYAATGGTIQLTALATDANNDPLTYTWTTTGGTFNANNARAVTWTAPNTEGVYQVNVTVTDNGNLSAQATTTILVKNFSSVPGKLIAHYPFTNHTDDVSGNQLHGQGVGIVFVADRNGVAQRASYFNGGSQHVRVNISPLLNVQNAITVSCWFNAARLPEKESFLLSHGSWQNRWKLSFTPEKNLRWTVNTLNAIADLDAPMPFTIDSFYYVTATYDGSLMALYVNGKLAAYKPLTGAIRTTTLPFLMGQMLSDNADYNFKGVIDEVKIFDYALSPPAVATLYQESTTALADIFTSKTLLLQVSPNPTADVLSVVLPFKVLLRTDVQINDIDGRLVLQKGFYTEGGVYNMDVKNLLPGIYMVTAQSDNQIAVARFVKL